MTHFIGNQVVELYESGRFADALLAMKGRPVETPAELDLAIRIHSNLERDAEARVLQRRLFLLHPASPEGARQRVHYLLERMRVLDALELSLSRGIEGHGDPRHEILWLSARARVLVAARDFDEAEAAVLCGLGRHPDAPRLRTDLAWIRFAGDRLEDAERMALEIVRERPRYFPARYLLCCALNELDRGESAVEALREAIAAFQAPILSSMAANAYLARNRPAEARTVLEDALARYPLAERGFRQLLLATLARAALLAGDRDAAIERAREGGRALARLARKLESARDVPGERVLVPVPFVRQEHMTCVPATFAAVLRHFGETIDPRAVAAEITYAGTPAFKSREWCRRHGYLARHFQFDAAVARDLVRRGVPFTLSTVTPFGGHMRAVIGHEPSLGTFILREPGAHARVEIDESDLEEEARSNVVTCAIVLPEREAGRVPPDILPLERESDAAIDLDEALNAHRLDAALEALAVIEASGPGPLLWRARRQIAWYRNDPEAALAASREHHAAFPDDAVAAERLASDLVATHRVDELRRFLESVEALPRPHPVLSIALARLLGPASSTHVRALRIARRAFRRAPQTGSAAQAVAELTWTDPLTRGRALLAHRVAACLEPYDENAAHTYFDACRLLGRADEGLRFVEERHKKLGGGSAAPAGTLAIALAALHRPDKALEILKAALARHEESWIRLLLVERLAALGRRNEARALLEESRDRLRPVDLLLARYNLADGAGDAAGALAALDEAAALNAQDVRVEAPRLELIDALVGPVRAKDEGLGLAKRFPEHSDLARLAYERLVAAGEDAEAEAFLRLRIESHPHETWASFRLGWHLLRTGRASDAIGLARANTEQWPHSGEAWGLLGVALAAIGDGGAGEALRRSIRLDADQSLTVRELVQRARGEEEAREALRFVAAEILRQGPGEGGAMRFVSLAERALPDDEIDSFLERLAAEYPGDPRTREAHCERLLIRGKTDEALERARRLREDFPWRSESGLLLARILSTARKAVEAIGVLRSLVALDPRNVSAWASLGGTLEGEGDLKTAEEVYTEAVAANPDSATLRGYTADALWRRGRHDEAIATLRRAIEIDSHYSWALLTEVAWLVSLGRADEALFRASEFAARAARLPAAHGALADACAALGRNEERIEALRRMLECDPRLGDARDSLAGALGELGRFDEARDVVREGQALLGDDPRLGRRLALLLRAESRHAEAKAELRTVLGRHPRFEDGWLTLLAWHDEDGDGADIVALHDSPPEALREAPAFWGYCGSALEAAKRTADAERAYSRAVAIDPGYEWGRVRLSAILDAGERSIEANGLFDEFRDPDAISPWMAAYVIGAAARRREAKRVVAFLARVLREERVDPASLRIVADGLFDLDVTTRRGIRDEIRKETRLRPGLAALDAALGLTRIAVRELDSIFDSPDGPRRVAAVFHMANRKDTRDAFGRWVRKRVRPPVDDVALWGAAGMVLLDSYPKSVLDLMGGDFRRPDARGWMLANLATAYRDVGRPALMEEVSLHALTLARDHSVWWHRTILAYARYLAGDFAEASSLAQVPVEDALFASLDGALVLCLAGIRSAADARSRRRVVAESVPRILDLARRLERDGEAPFRDRFLRARAREILRAVRSAPALRLASSPWLDRVRRFTRFFEPS